MEPPESNAFVVTLRLAGEGQKSAAAELLPVLYDELRRLAEVRLIRSGPHITLQPTALVHEAYLRLVGKGDPGWNGKGHFFGAAAKAMRNILVERARRKSSVKHGGMQERVGIETIEQSPDLAVDQVDFVSLDEALTALEEHSPEAAHIVMLRYFAGLSIAESAKLMGMSDDVVVRKWEFARAWLHRRLH